jgi:hypothetical protein
MKKYFIASMVAVMAFAFAAFAASLTVNGGVLQAGSDTDLTCTDRVEVDFVGFEGDAVDSNGKRVGGGFTTVTLDGLDDCEGAFVYTRIFDNEGLEIWRSVPIPTAENASSQRFADGQIGSYTLYGATPTQAGSIILSQDIAAVEIQIDG